ncbi:hypothetical protein M2140_000144 [Clostridiales Family XIII bacterium PM5-7]
MGTSYMVVYNRFLSKVTDYFIYELTDEDTVEYCHNLMISAIANLKKIENDLTDVDEELQAFNAELNNKEIEYIACRMVCEWLDPQINNTTLTKQYIGTKDEKFYAPANQLSELRKLRDEGMARAQKIRRDYLYSTMVATT